MSEEEMQRKMEFIVEQQAQFAADIGQLRDALGQLENVVTRLANATLQGFENFEGRVSTLTESLDDKVSALVDAQIKSEEKISALAESQARTDDRLNAFITVVERYVSEGRNGVDKG